MKHIKYLIKPTVISIFILCLSFLLAYKLIESTPRYEYLQHVQIPNKIKDGDEVKNTNIKLGNIELGQKSGSNSADSQHLSIRYNDNQWMIANISPKKKIAIKQKSNNEWIYLKRWKIMTGDIIKINDTVLNVKNINGKHIIFQSNNKKTYWNGSVLNNPVKENFSGCPDNNFLYSMRLHADYLIGNSRDIFTIGGGAQCHNHWKLPVLPYKSASIEFKNGDFWFHPLRNDVDFTFEHKKDKKKKKTNSLEVVIQSNDSLIIGRTTYKVNITSEYLKLKPIEKKHLFLKEGNDNKTSDIIKEYKIHTKWKDDQWGGANILWIAPLKFYIITAILLGISILLSFLILALNSEIGGIASSFKTIFFSLAIPVLCFSIGSQLLGQHLTALLFAVYISLFWVTYLLFRQKLLVGLTGWIWVCSLFFATFGLLTLSQLAAGAENTRWLRYPEGYVWFLLLLSMLLAVLIQIPIKGLQGIWQQMTVEKSKIIKWGYFFILLVVAGLLFLQFTKGSESGLGYVQPVEFVKLILVISLSYMTLTLNEYRILNSEDFQNNKILWVGRVLLILFILLMIITIVMFGVHDFSPLLIIFSILLAYYWIVIRHPVIPRLKSLWIARSIVLLIIIGIISGGWFLHENPEMAFWIKQSDRFLIWANPWEYPDTGRQIQLSLMQVHSGSWWGTNWFGVNADAMNLPAIQDDFILAFSLFKFGGVASLFLLFFQLFWVGLQFYLVQQLLIRPPSRREERLSQSMLAYILYGLVWMQLLHWLISWGNVLGLLPIMGQPMTWLSTGNSHLLAIALPALILSLFASFILSYKPK